MFDVIVSCASSVYLWLHIQTLVDFVGVSVWRVLRWDGYRVMFPVSVSS
jgi:hypothetical protein